MADVELRQVTKTFGKEIGIDAVSLKINNGEFVVLLGPTGAGKTTTLRCIAGLEKPDSGEILIDGVNVIDDSPAQRDVAMVFQQYSLYPHLSVRENLEFPLKSPILKTPVDIMNKKVNEVAEVLRISHKLDNKAIWRRDAAGFYGAGAGKKPSNLSDG
jgi:multiple sugar transport system ATP-binding protein